VFNLPKLVSGLIIPGTAVLCAAGIIALQQPTLQTLHSQLDRSEYLRQEQAEKVTLDLWQRLPTFGFDNLLANWVFLQFIQYFGDTSARNQTGYSLVPEYFEVIVNRDPRFVDAYLTLSAASSLFAGRPDRTVALMDQGLRSLTPETSPNAYYVWLYKAVDEVLFMGDTQSAKHSYKTAAEWARIQGNQRIAAQAEQTAQFLAKNPDSRRVRISAWLLILNNANDDYTRKRSLQEIQRLGGQVNIHQQDGAISVEVKVPQDD
jgi:hypothetical protein